jgi:UDP-N-acetylmuramate dehydrogenase
MIDLGIAALTSYALDDLEAAATAAGLVGAPRRGEPLSRHTSLRVGGPADLYVKATTVDAVVTWVRLARERDLPAPLVLGRGSNVLASDRGVRGVVIEVACAAHTLTVRGDTGLLTVEAGASLPALAYQLARDGWGGFEQAIGIPGSVGASVVNNAGAHGWSMSDNVTRVEVLGPQGSVYELPADKLAFEYRGSRFKHQHRTERELVLRVDMTVDREDPATLQTAMADYTAHRRRTQPTDPSVGSMFKNPPGDYAGRLIEAVGLKGHRVGQAQISPKHANFFVNLGGATAADVTALIHAARAAVRESFGISLELEIEPIGDWGDSDV